jgi:hypothetical protein
MFLVIRGPPKGERLRLKTIALGYMRAYKRVQETYSQAYLRLPCVDASATQVRVTQSILSRFRQRTTDQLELP